MIAKLLVKPFGSIWKIKKKCSSSSFLVSRVARLIYDLYQYENNSSVAWIAEFKSEPCFPHGMKSIFISGATIIGDNCVIFQQVTIGSVANPDAKNQGAPVIGDNVYVGAGAAIVGEIKIGNNVRIGANAVVYSDVEDNSVVVSGQQKVIKKDEPLDNRFYSFHDKWVYFDKGVSRPVVDENILASLKKL